MDQGSLALALGAGLVAAVNPCGFALLPAYLSLILLDDQPTRVRAVLRALRATAAMTAGFAGVFLLFGLAIAPVASWVLRYLPGFTVVLGLALAALGLWVLAGRSLPVPRPGRGGGRPLTGGFWSMTGFGASYAVASLGCTIAPFLAVVVTAFRAGSTVDGVALFLAYALGMGAVVGAAAVASALARGVLTGKVRRLGPVLGRLGGGLLLVAGAYVAWYGAWELRVLHGTAGRDPVVDAASEVQQRLVDVVQTVGAGGFAVLLILSGRAHRSRRSSRIRLISAA
jgi:cytochrome c-type biogenesis protein